MSGENLDTGIVKHPFISKPIGTETIWSNFIVGQSKFKFYCPNSQNIRHLVRCQNKSPYSDHSPTFHLFLTCCDGRPPILLPPEIYGPLLRPGRTSFSPTAVGRNSFSDKLKNYRKTEILHPCTGLGSTLNIRVSMSFSYYLRRETIRN